jgi:hypothetical protein
MRWQNIISLKRENFSEVVSHMFDFSRVLCTIFKKGIDKGRLIWYIRICRLREGRREKWSLKTEQWRRSGKFRRVLTGVDIRKKRV